MPDRQESLNRKREQCEINDGKNENQAAFEEHAPEANDEDLRAMFRPPPSYQKPQFARGHDVVEMSHDRNAQKEANANAEVAYANNETSTEDEISGDFAAEIYPTFKESSDSKDIRRKPIEGLSEIAETLELDMPVEEEQHIAPSRSVFDAPGRVTEDDDVPFKLPEVSEDSFDLGGDAGVAAFREPGIIDSEAMTPGGIKAKPDSDPEFYRTQPTIRHQPVAYSMESDQYSYNTATGQRAAGPEKIDFQSANPGYRAPQKSRSSSPGSIKRPRRRRFFRPGCLWIIMGLLVTACGGLTLTVLGAAAIFMPQVEAQWSQQVAFVDEYRSFESTFFYDRHGNLLYEAFGEGRRSRVPYDRFPQNLIKATIAIEDDTFFENIGIDVAATGVAALQFLGASSEQQTPGGSTITQQLVRNVLFDFEKRNTRSIERKVEEIILAILLTQRKPKEEILELYLNEIYYGNLAYGAQTAAQVFFGKDVEDLALGEAALLAGLPQAPANLDPLNSNPEVQQAVLNRWRQVLDEMVDEGFIASAEREQALRAGLNFVLPDSSLEAPHFTVYARGELERLMLQSGYSPEEIARGGLKVYTTVDQDVNNLALRAAQNQVTALQSNQVSNAAVLVTKPLTGEIVAMAGSIDYNSEIIDGRVNVTTAFRQPGSTMKPFTYSAAMERGMTPADVIWDTRTSITIPGQPVYAPRNYDGGFHGPMTMRYALANSYNIPAVQALRLVGVDYLLEIMRRFGVESLDGDAGQYGLSLTLGGGEITLVELVNAYAVFANLGSYVPVTSILCVVDSDDNIIYQYENSCPEGRITARTIDRVAPGRQVLDPRIAYIITDILSDNDARSAAMGANSPLRADGIEAAVKTGTTNDVKDNWTVGYTGNVAVGVWVGNNDGQPMVNSSGLTGAAPIWNSVITGIYHDSRLLASFTVGGQLLPDKPAPPSGISLRQICDPRRVTDPSSRCPAVIQEWMLDGPVGIPDAEGNLRYVQELQRSAPDSGSYLSEISPGIYSTLVFPIPPQVASGIQFQLAPGDAQPLPPKYCRVPPDLINAAPGAQELVFVAGPATSQPDAVEAEKYARQNGIAFLPIIDCWPEVFSIAQQNFGPSVVSAIITSPAPYQVVSGSMPIIGTVQFAPGQVNFYKIEILGGPFSDWTTLGNVQTNPVTNGQLEFLQAEALPPGDYQLRLALVDDNSGFLQQPYVVPFTKQ